MNQRPNLIEAAEAYQKDMTHIEVAIKEAVEKGGYKPLYSNKRHQDHWFGFEERMDLCLPTLFLDPAFWQALGKSRGWYAGEYKQKAESFMSDLMEGKDAESFFKSLV